MRGIPDVRAGVILAMAWSWSTAAWSESAAPTRLGLCAACHGERGQATLAGVPHLAGQDEAYLLAQLQAYRSGARNHAQMRAAVGSLRESDLADLARWYAAQDPCHVRTQQADR